MQEQNVGPREGTWRVIAGTSQQGTEKLAVLSIKDRCSYNLFYRSKFEFCK